MASISSLCSSAFKRRSTRFIRLATHSSTRPSRFYSTLTHDETREEKIQRLRDEAIRPENMDKWTKQILKTGGLYDLAHQTVAFLYDNDLLDLEGGSLSDLDFQTLRLTARMVETDFIDTKTQKDTSWKALMDLEDDSNTLDAALQELELLTEKDLKWTMPIPFLLYKIFSENRKIQYSNRSCDFMEAPEFVNAWIKLQKEFKLDIGFQPEKVQDSKLPRVEAFLDLLQEKKVGAYNPRGKCLLQIEKRNEKTFLRLTEIPQGRVLNVLQKNQGDVEDLKFSILENINDHREIRHIAIILTKHVPTFPPDKAIAGFEGLPAATKLLLSAFNIDSAEKLNDFRKREAKVMLEDENEPYITHKTKLQTNAFDTITKLFGHNKGKSTPTYNEQGYRTSFPKPGLNESQTDAIMNEYDALENFENMNETERVMHFRKFRDRLRKRTESPPALETILDPHGVKDDDLSDFNDLVNRDLHTQFEEQYREGFVHTIRKRFKVCPYTIPSFPVDESKEIEITHWNVRYLSKFVNERGMVLPRRLTGVSTHAQKKITAAICKSKLLGLMPRDKKWMFVDNKPLKHAQWIRLSTEEQKNNKISKNVELDFNPIMESEHRFGFEGLTREQVEEKLEEKMSSMGLNAQDLTELTPTMEKDMREWKLSDQEKSQALKYEPDAYVEDGLDQPKNVDVDELYGLSKDDPEVYLTELAKLHRSKYRDNLQDEFQRNYEALSQYWKEQFAPEKAKLSATPTQISN